VKHGTANDLLVFRSDEGENCLGLHVCIDVIALAGCESTADPIKEVAITFSGVLLPNVSDQRFALASLIVPFLASQDQFRCDAKEPRPWGPRWVETIGALKRLHYDVIQQFHGHGWNIATSTQVCAAKIEPQRAEEISALLFNVLIEAGPAVCRRDTGGLGMGNCV